MSKSTLIGIVLSTFFIFCLLLSIGIGLSAHDKAENIELTVDDIESRVDDLEPKVDDLEFTVDNFEYRMR
jgi:tetrahydromethanopterin S-methyltransferase subunit B